MTVLLRDRIESDIIFDLLSTIYETILNHQ